MLCIVHVQCTILSNADCFYINTKIALVGVGWQIASGSLDRLMVKALTKEWHRCRFESRCMCSIAFVAAPPVTDAGTTMYHVPSFPLPSTSSLEH